MQSLLPRDGATGDPQPRDRGACLGPAAVGAARAVARRCALCVRAGRSTTACARSCSWPPRWRASCCPIRPPCRPREQVSWHDAGGAASASSGTARPCSAPWLFDLVSTLFGGVSALLPIYARDILEIGPWGAGILRSAPALGGLDRGRSAQRAFRCGDRAALHAVVGFAIYGAATIVFGMSSNLSPLDRLPLMVIGSGDMLSSVVRQTLIQMTDARRDARPRLRR